MDLRHYQHLAGRTIPDDQDTKTLLANSALGLCGEAGEVGNLIKKVVFHKHPLTEEQRHWMLEEVGDCLWYLASICTALQANLSEVGMDNIAKLKARYPQGFTVDCSINRVV